MDFSFIVDLPEPAKSIVIKTVSTLAADATKRLIGAAGGYVRKRFKPAEREAALERAMTEALAVTVTKLTPRGELAEHYLGLFREWILRDGVIGELTQLIDPRPDTELDYQLLRDEFRAAGYDPDQLGEGVKFEEIIAHFIGAFRSAAKKEKELQDEIKIDLLERLVQLTEQMLERVQDQPRAGYKPKFIFGPSFNAHVINIYGAPAGQAKLREPDVQRILNDYLDYVARAHDNARLFGLESGPVARPASIQRLTDIFIPLTLRRFKPPVRRELEDALSGKTGIDALKAQHELWHSDDRAGAEVPLSDLLSVSERLAIVGGAGCGKSTVLAYLASTLARAARTGEGLPYELPDSTPLIPLIVPLRYYRDYLECCKGAPDERLRDPRAGTLAGFIPWYLKRRSPALQVSEDFFDRLLQGKGCLLMIDGLDEVVSREQRGYVRQEVEDLVKNVYPGNRVIVTAREAGYRGEAVFGDDFTRLDVQPLNDEQIATLVENWCRRLYPEDVTGNRDKLVSAISSINELRHERDLPVLINTPLMTTMVVSIQWGETELPRERARLYEAAVKAIIQAQYIPDDPARGELMNWGGPWEEQRNWLSDLALAMHQEGSGGAAKREEGVRAILGQTQKDAELKAFLQAVRYRGGLFEERAEFFQFIHLTFQEFLAARLLAKRREASRGDLQPHIGDSWWREVFLLVYGYLQMDYPPAATDYLKWLSHLEGSPGEMLGAAELAGAAVLEIERPNAELRRGLADRLVALLTDKNLECPASLRGAAGRTLARLGDPRPGVGIRDGLPDIDWIEIEPGPFIMGSTDEQAKYDDEKPQFMCGLIRTGYCVSRYPVTVAQYQAFIEACGYGERRYWTKAGRARRQDEKRTGPAAFGKPFELANHPQVGVSWYEAVAFCNWLSVKLGYGVSLPTEAQWERAARHTDGRIYPWGNQEEAGQRCNMAETGLGTTSAVGIFPMGNARCGAADAAGNVWEWCRTKWREDYREYETKVDDGLKGEERRVLRGGAFNFDDVRCAFRYGDSPNLRKWFIGFRVVASPFTSEL